MRIEDKLQLQSTEHPVVYLHRERESWKSYNQSAWYFNQYFPDFTPLCDKTLEELSFVYIPVEDALLKDVLQSKSYAQIDNNLIAIDCTIKFDEDKYQKWLQNI